MSRRLAQVVGVQDRVGTVAADLRTSPLPGGRVEVGLLGNVAQYLAGGELAAVLARLRAALVPGGVLQLRGVMVDDGTPGVRAELVLRGGECCWPPSRAAPQ